MGPPSPPTPKNGGPPGRRISKPGPGTEGRLASLANFAVAEVPADNRQLTLPPSAYTVRCVPPCGGDAGVPMFHVKQYERS